MDDGYIKNGNVLMLGAGKDGLTYPASGSSPALVLDASGNGNNGINSGAVLVDSDTALSFDGVNDIANLPTITNGCSGGSNGQFTISFWYYHIETSGDSVIQKYGLGTEILINANATSLSAYVYGNPTLNYLFLLCTGLAVDNWYHITLAYNASLAGDERFRFYVNGVKRIRSVIVGGVFTEITPTNSIWRIGINGGNLNYTALRIRELAFYSIRMSDEDIASIYNGNIITNNLLAYYPMNRLNCRTNTGIDFSGNGNVITNNGATPCPDHNGRANRGWRFVKTNSAKLVYPNTLIRNKQQFTIGYWVKLDAGEEFVAFNSISNLLLRHETSLNYNLVYFSPESATDYGYFSLSNIDVWNHYIWIFDGGLTTNADKLKLVVNGSQVNLSFNGAIPVVTSNNDTELATGFRAGIYRTGSISVPLFYNRALSISEAQKVYKYSRTH